MRRGASALLAFVLVAALAWLAPAAARAAPKFPALSGRVVDEANVLTPDVRADLTAKLAALEAKTSRQLVVVTLASLQDYDIADYGYQLGRAWGIGQKGLDNGVLFIVAPTERKTRIEVGYKLEPILTDALSSVILQARVLPKFKAGDMPGGIVDGTDALIEQMSLDPSVAEQRVAAAAAAASEQGRPTSSARHGGPLALILNLIVIAVVLSFVLGRRGRRSGLGGLWPLIFMNGLGGGGRGWGDGDGGGFGGGGGGGGFSGGGGSFGGGGSSGSW